MTDNSAYQPAEVLLDYLPKLIRLAEKNMSGQIQQKVGSDDVANSVIASVVRAWTNGTLKIDIEDSDDFWRYLVAVSLNKIRKKVRSFKTNKRNFDLEMPLSKIEFLVQEQGDPSEEGGVAVATLLKQLEVELNEDQLLVLRGKLDGQSNEEIAEKLNFGNGRSTKTVTRQWKLIEERVKNLVVEIEVF